MNLIWLCRFQFRWLTRMDIRRHLPTTECAERFASLLQSYTEMAGSGRLRNQVRAEVEIKSVKRIHFGRREPKSDVTIWADESYAPSWKSCPDRIDAGIMRDLHELRPSLAKLREQFAIG